MKLSIVTIVLDGMPYIERHLAEFENLKCDWHWYIIEGASDNTKDQSWCKKQKFRLSDDGTTEYLDSIKANNRVTVLRSPRWENKTSMLNSALCLIRDPGVLLQVDSDEIWKDWQIDGIVNVFSSMEDVNMMQFYCNYYVGPDVVTTSSDGYGNKPGEWLRAWRFKRGMRFDKHEPPILSGNKGMCLTRDQTKFMGLVFDHYSWATEKQVSYKEMFYGYTNALSYWKKLQNNTEWPVKLKQFLPWVDENATATRI